MTAPSSQALWHTQVTLVWMQHCQGSLAECEAWWEPHRLEFWSLQSAADPPAVRNHRSAWDDLRGESKGLWRFAASCRALCGRAGCDEHRFLNHRYCPQSSILTSACPPSLLSVLYPFGARSLAPLFVFLLEASLHPQGEAHTHGCLYLQLWVPVGASPFSPEWLRCYFP